MFLHVVTAHAGNHTADDATCTHSAIAAAPSACDFVSAHCQDEGWYTQTYYCADDEAFLLLFPFCGFLLLLFSLLASTADDYFSPALEQLSKVKSHLHV